jgi:hypothetical protein
VAFDYEHETRVFSKTFRVLKVTLGENAFSKMNQYKNFVSRFLSYHYEAFTLGIQKYLERLDPENGTQMRMLDEALRRVKASPDFRALTTGGGKNYPGPLRQRIEFVETNLEGIV